LSLVFILYLLSFVFCLFVFAGVTSEGYHIYNVCTYDKEGHQVTSVWRRFSEFCTLDEALQRQLEVSTSRNYNLYTSQIEGLLPSKTLRKLDAGRVTLTLNPYPNPKPIP
jgi:hypothetical protein